MNKIIAERRSTIPVLTEKFSDLVKNQFLMHSISTPLTNESTNEKSIFDLPTFNIKSITRLTQDQEADPGDSHIYWKVNFDRLDQDLRYLWLCFNLYFDSIVK